jgi:hypothetical protein
MDYEEKELTLRQKYVKAAVNRAKREVALEKKIDELIKAKDELFASIDKLKNS